MTGNDARQDNDELGLGLGLEPETITDLELTEDDADTIRGARKASATCNTAGCDATY